LGPSFGAKGLCELLMKSIQPFASNLSKHVQG